MSDRGDIGAQNLNFYPQLPQNKPLPAPKFVHSKKFSKSLKYEAIASYPYITSSAILTRLYCDRALCSPRDWVEARLWDEPTEAGDAETELPVRHKFQSPSSMSTM